MDIAWSPPATAQRDRSAARARAGGGHARSRPAARPRRTDEGFATLTEMCGSSHPRSSSLRARARESAIEGDRPRVIRLLPKPVDIDDLGLISRAPSTCTRSRLRTAALERPMGRPRSFDDHRIASDAQGTKTIERVATRTFGDAARGQRHRQGMLAARVHEQSGSQQRRVRAINWRRSPKTCSRPRLFATNAARPPALSKPPSARSSWPRGGHYSSTRSAHPAGAPVNCCVHPGAGNRAHRRAVPIAVDTRIVSATHQNPRR